MPGEEIRRQERDSFRNPGNVPDLGNRFKLTEVLTNSSGNY